MKYVVAPRQVLQASVGMVLLAITPASAPAQQITRLDGMSGCRGCAVQAAHVVTLGDERRGIIANPQAVVRDLRGRYVVVHDADQAALYVFDQAGEFMQRLGRRGGGPGEYEIITQLDVDAAGNLRVWDPFAGRVTVLDSAFRYRESVRILNPVATLAHADSYYFAFGNLRTPAAEGHPLHLLDARGTVLRSFGGDGTEYRSREADLFRRRVAIGDDGALWSARYTEYVLERWDRNGALVERVERLVPWFRPGKSVTRRDIRSSPPEPRLRAFDVDADGRIWLLIWVPDREWKEGIDTIRGIYGRPEIAVPYAARDRYWDTVVEVIDPVHKRILGSNTFDQAFDGFADPSHVYTYREDEQGHPFIDVFRLTVTPGSGGWVQPHSRTAALWAGMYRMSTLHVRKVGTAGEEANAPATTEAHFESAV
jgi:hypothetical protein